MAKINDNTFTTERGVNIYSKDKVLLFLTQNVNCHVFNTSKKKSIIFKYGYFEIWKYNKPNDLFHQEIYIGRDFNEAFILLNQR